MFLRKSSYVCCRSSNLTTMTWFDASLIHDTPFLASTHKRRILQGNVCSKHAHPKPMCGVVQTKHLLADASLDGDSELSVAEFMIFIERNVSFAFFGKISASCRHDTQYFQPRPRYMLTMLTLTRTTHRG